MTTLNRLTRLIKYACLSVLELFYAESRIQTYGSGTTRESNTSTLHARLFWTLRSGNPHKIFGLMYSFFTTSQGAIFRGLAPGNASNHSSTKGWMSLLMKFQMDSRQRGYLSHFKKKTWSAPYLARAASTSRFWATSTLTFRWWRWWRSRSSSTVTFTDFLEKSKQEKFCNVWYADFLKDFRNDPIHCRSEWA